ncbi:Mitochondrial fission protein [Epichloe bromicola]|uniref:Mitochondrial fission protein n=1 Tax=Epichloe bromicola TaxID=79588 RepID=A0ABQ0CVV9_9HYPO
MYGSYGSYSSLSTMSAPLDISFNNIRNHDSSCAFPSWPRRSSLSDSKHEEPRATSYLSDDDLFPSDPFDDDKYSVCSSSSSSSPATAPMKSPPRISDEEFLRRECERVTMQKEYLRQVKMEKERRRQVALRVRKSSPRKSPKNKQASLTTITESDE